MAIDLSPEHIARVKGLLALHLPTPIPVLVFGSRGNGLGLAHVTSDLDLALMTKERLPAAVMTNLREAFVASDLPCSVDVVDWAATEKHFQQKILAGYSVLAPDFFVSYTAHDLGWAQWLAYQLEDAGYTTVLQVWDFKAGNNFVHEMHQAMQFSRFTLAVLSPDYLSSDWCGAEMLAAVANDPLGKKQKIIGVRIADCQPAGLLAGRVYIDLQNKGEQAARTLLVDEIQKALSVGRNKPSTAPAFPGVSVSSPATIVRRVNASRPAATRFPNSAPPFLNAPIGLDATERFVGRQEIYQDVQTALLGGKAAPTVVCGTAGVGKTMLAMRLAKGVAHAFDAMCWVNAETDNTLSSSFADLADGLGLRLPEGMKQPERIAAVKAHINQSARVLLVLDNAEDAKLIAPYLPSSEGVGSKALLTSRSAKWDGMQRFNLDVFSSSEAAQFWQTHGEETWLQNAEEMAVAQTLSHELGYLPLALRQAAAYMQDARLVPSAYLQRWQTKSQKLALLEYEGELSDYKTSLAVVLELSLEKLKAQLPAAYELLTMCTQLSFNNIPLELIRRGLYQLTDPARELFKLTCPALEKHTRDLSLAGEWDDLRIALNKTAIAHCKDGMFSWHRLNSVYVHLNLKKLDVTALWQIVRFTLFDTAHSTQEGGFAAANRNWDCGGHFAAFLRQTESALGVEQGNEYLRSVYNVLAPTISAGLERESSKLGALHPDVVALRNSINGVNAAWKLQK